MCYHFLQEDSKTIARQKWTIFDNFKGFTEKANAALNYAITEAEELGHDYIGSEHFILGILDEGTSAAAVALKNLNVTKEDFKELVEAHIGKKEKTSLTVDNLTPRSKRILQVSALRAGQLQHKYVGTEHILICIMGEKDSYAAHFLSMLGVRVRDVYSELSKIISPPSSPVSNSSEDFKNSNSAPKSSESSSLEQFGRDLTKMAANGEIDPVIGRKEEIERVIQILSRRTKNNPCLIGEPGVGKTAVAEGLALKIFEGEVPEILKNKRIISLDLTGMIAGTKYRGDFEERIKNAMDEVRGSDDSHSR